MIKALPNAVKLWNDPRDLIGTWIRDPDKKDLLRLVTQWVGKVGTIADLGCGVGWSVRSLQFDEYFGFDQATAMVRIATKNLQRHGVSFAQTDIFNYVSDRTYDVVLMLDVAQHQNSPLGAVGRMLELWKGDRYIFTILVGDKREEVLNSIVEDRREVAATLKALGVKVVRHQTIQVKNTTFGSSLMEVRRARI